MWDKITSGVRDALFEDKKAAEVQQPPQAQPTRIQVGSGGGTAPTPQQWQPQINQEFVDIIRKKTFSRNTALTALISASDALTDIIPDPIMRLKAAHKTAGAGRPQKEFVDAVNIHMNDVNNEAANFERSLSKKKDEVVGALRRQANDLEATSQTKQQQIVQLEKQIATLREQLGNDVERVAQLRAEADANEVTFSHDAQEFEMAAAHVRSELEGHKNTILSTL